MCKRCKQRVCENTIDKRVLGRSIEERLKEVDTRKEFGHRESDLVIGQKSGKNRWKASEKVRKTPVLYPDVPDRTAAVAAAECNFSKNYLFLSYIILLLSN